MEKPRLTERLVTTCKRWLQRIWRVLLLVSALLMVSGCAAGRNWKYLPASQAEERSVFVVDHGWHTGIVLSREDLGQELGFVPEYLRPGRYYEFGWGEAEFYQADQVTASIFLKTVFGRNPSVMLVASLPVTPSRYYSGGDVVELHLSATGLAHLKDALRASFRFDAGKPFSLKGGLHGESRFFQAAGYYTIINTCNRWTAKILASGGVPMDTVFTLRAASVMRQAHDAQKEYLRLRQFQKTSPPPL